MVVAGGVLPFHLERSPVRGRIVRLGALADAILSRHDVPESVARLNGQALALVAAMASALKFQGSLSLQVKGDGPVSMLLADATNNGGIRGLARLDDDADTSALPDDAAGLLGNGYLAFTIDQGPDTERHQGVVEIKGQTLSEMAEHYFTTSEQHACHIRLFCTRGPNGWEAGALVLERIAADGGADTQQNDAEDAWETACAFADTLRENELFNEKLSAQDLTHRLFGTLDVQDSAPRALAYSCHCSRSRLVNVLTRFSDDDLDHMAEDGVITMKCEFCNHDFRFSRDNLSATDPA
ncbi:Hsp33 family molecular chaperone HslO [Neokomagataea sp. TBRC 2177]|uniref:Hsp33 family molecular chaperone HslO n=2 Tax=Neokomagataea anthophila TaxID=2826925 RepID=A0ABS5E8R5_9PROT|nr:Hsp33 family molecular chaperone HslO [Neokomagataea anthophila]MBR0560293.1 Hsp33 family molecular chaperone HslO [Neokomagataea anthophila]